MILVARIAALSLLTSALVAALGLAVLTAFTGPGIPSSEFVIPGLVLACVGGIIGAIAGTAREIVAAQRAPQPQTEELSTGTKRRFLRVAAALVVCFLCLMVVWFKARSSATGAAIAREPAVANTPADELPPVPSGTTDSPPPLFDGERRNETGRLTDEPKPELLLQREFQIQRGNSPTEIKREGRQLMWVTTDVDCDVAPDVKPGDVVDLFLTNVEEVVVLDSDQTYEPSRSLAMDSVLVEHVRLPATNEDRSGIQLGILVTPAQVARVRSKTNADEGETKNTTHVIRLKHHSAKSVAELLALEFTSCKFVADPEQNTVAVRRQWNGRDPLGELLRVESAIQKLDVRPKRTVSEMTVFRAVPNTPAAKQLVEQLEAQESAAAAEAATIRQLQAKGQAEQNQQPIAEHQRKLKNLLSTAFDLKLQLEELQVKELQSRLSRLERQIGQRKQLREKIIARRAGELIEVDALKWTPDASTDVVNRARSKPMSRESAAETPRGAAIEDQRPVPLPNPREQDSGPVRSTQIHLVGPKGMEALLSTDGVFKPAASFAVPLRRNFERRHDEVTQHSIGFKNVPNHAATRFLGVLKLYPDHAHTAEFLNHNAIPLVITNEDIERAISKKPGFVNPVTKIVYLPHPAVSQTANTSVETLVSTRLDPGVNPIDEAKRRGSILAVFSFHESGPPTTTASEVERPHEADGIVVDLYAGSQVLPGLQKNLGYSKLVQSLDALKGVTVNFREAGKGDVIVMAIVRDPSQRCQREARQTQAESELRIAINSALQAAGIEATRWDENIEAKSADKSEAEGTTSN